MECVIAAFLWSLATIQEKASESDALLQLEKRIHAARTLVVVVDYTSELRHGPAVTTVKGEATLRYKGEDRALFTFTIKSPGEPVSHDRGLKADILEVIGELGHLEVKTDLKAAVRVKTMYLRCGAVHLEQFMGALTASAQEKRALDSSEAIIEKQRARADGEHTILAYSGRIPAPLFARDEAHFTCELTLAKNGLPVSRRIETKLPGRLSIVTERFTRFEVDGQLDDDDLRARRR